MKTTYFLLSLAVLTLSACVEPTASERQANNAMLLNYLGTFNQPVVIHQHNTHCYPDGGGGVNCSSD